jgi:trypsin/PEP-CTERM motif-containing protein
MNRTSTRLQAAAIVAATFIAGVFTAPAVAGTMQANEYDFIHRQMGATTPEARSVGSITMGWETDSQPIRGSGVLVGGRYVLTAAHLVDDAVGGNFYINGQNYGIQSWVVANRFYSRGDDDDPNPDSRNFGSGADLALVMLNRRVVGAQNLKATINKSRKEAGKTATIVGWGRGGSGALGVNDLLNGPIPPLPGDGSRDAGGVSWNYRPTLRAGKNIVEPNGPFTAFTTSNRELVTDFDPAPNQLPSLLGLFPPQIDTFTGEWDIDEDDIPISGEYMPAIGDSGGGLFINGRLAGITSWTTRGNSEYFSQAHYTRLSVGWWKWVRDNIKAYNRLRADPTLTPWIRADNPKGKGAGFRGVARIQAEADDEDAGIVEGQVLGIFGPGLFYDENAAHFDVGDNFYFIANDLNASSAPLPEPASLALLGLGGLAMLRRSRR